FDLAQARELYPGEGLEASAVEQELIKLKERCQRLEPVNLAALIDFEALSKRYLFLKAQAEDLSRSASSLRQTISEIDKTTERLFDEAFASINQYFREYCTALFGGGSAQIRLRKGMDSSEEGEEAGVELMVSLPGKHLAHLGLLSGGEKALAGLAFLMALFRYRPSPFSFLDEVDAPLDDANLERFLSLLVGLSQRHQFILVTHNKKTMEAADCLYGVTMEEPGISKVVSVKWDGSSDRSNDRRTLPSGRRESNGD
ncbi:MAG: chromosome segregation protein SMC, partial [candidate division NC10 bacterium]|nr:chromosome segregation protein SMC [candidate division NC10 bacterium]